MKNIPKISVLCGLIAMSGAAWAQGTAEAGRAKVELCIGCHGIPGGYKATYPEVYRVPKIGGQSAKYLEAALKGYRSGERKHPTMRSIAGSLSDQDMADIAAYFAAQK